MITYREAVDISGVMLVGFFADWPERPSAETHLRLLRNSDHVVIAVDEKENRVVGFVTAITDGVLAAYIPFLEVRADYEGKGIGKELMTRMLARLKDMYMVDLICDPDVQNFYASLGMKTAVGMSIRNKQALIEAAAK